MTDRIPLEDALELEHLGLLARAAEWRERQPVISQAERDRHRQNKLDYWGRVRELEKLHDNVR